MFSFGHCPNYLNPRATWSSFFGRQNSRFESQPKTTLNNLKQPKKQLKVQYIGIFEEIDSFY